jgi:uncharacterized protein (TIGR00251 family)
MECIREQGSDCIFCFKTKVNCNEFKIIFQNNIIEVEVKNQPQDNKVNIELLKEFKKLFKKSVKFLTGLKMKHKCIIIENITREEVISKIKS